jgi:hypothetical protein
MCGKSVVGLVSDGRVEVVVIVIIGARRGE